MRYKIALKTFASDQFLISAAKLSTVWLAGLVLGFFVAVKTISDLRPYFLVLCTQSNCFLSVFFIILMPFLFSVCFAHFFSANSVLIVVFLKAAVFAFVACSYVCCWGSAGWLISRILLFSDFLGIPVLIWMWYRIFCGRLKKNDVILFLLLLSIICIADCFFVSHFACSLL